MEYNHIDLLINQIYNGTRNIPRFNQQEHAGICSAGPLLIGALIVCDNARESLEASCNASGSQGSPANWKIDETQEHELLFPETIMRIVGFTRDDDELFRIILTQPYIECQRLASKEEIDNMVVSKGFQDNGDGKGINYISDHLHLEDMHPANVFIEPNTGLPVCIDCIVKFRR
ncbi:MAG: hypothetical protein PUC42_03295 [Bacteroidales bacterium]|jgi:hypothetical protein|nr:hypothetical protein [Bacteroidales bacterium]